MWIGYRNTTEHRSRGGVFGIFVPFAECIYLCEMAKYVSMPYLTQWRKQKDDLGIRIRVRGRRTGRQGSAVAQVTYKDLHNLHQNPSLM